MMVSLIRALQHSANEVVHVEHEFILYVAPKCNANDMELLAVASLAVTIEEEKQRELQRALGPPRNTRCVSKLSLAACSIHLKFK